MKKIQFLILTLFFCFASSVFATEYDITQYHGENGLVRPQFYLEDGDILNLKNDVFSMQSHSYSVLPSSSEEGGTLTINGNGYVISGNSSDDVGHSLFLGTLKVSNTTYTGLAGVIRAEEANFEFTDVDVIGNKEFPLGWGDRGPALSLSLASKGVIYAKNRDVLFKDNSYFGEVCDIELIESQLALIPYSNRTIFLMGGIRGNGELYIGDEFGGVPYGTLALGGDNSNFAAEGGLVSVYGSTVKLLEGAYYFGPEATNVYAGNSTLDLQNGLVDYVGMAALLIDNNGMNLKIDVDLSAMDFETGDAGLADTVFFEKFSIFDDSLLRSSDNPQAGNAKIRLTSINLIDSNDSDKEVTSFRIFPSAPEFAHEIIEVQQKKAYGRLYEYEVKYDSTTMMSSQPTIPIPVRGDAAGGEWGEYALHFLRKGYSPFALQPVFAVSGAKHLEEELRTVVFNDIGNFGYFTKVGASAGDIPRDNPTMWVKAFGNFNEFDFNDYRKVDTDYFGGIAGLDFDRKYETFDATYGIFGAYVNGKQKDDGMVTIEQSGGYLGAKGTMYFGKLYLSGMLNVGYLSNSADTSRGSDDFYSNVYGLSLKGGYNFELSERSFTLQPNVMLGYSYVLTEDFTNSLGTKIETDDTNILEVVPGLKLAKNLGKCWILSGDLQYVISSVSGDVKADSILLPEVDYDDYIRYGLGIEKIWGYTVANLKAFRSDGGKSGWNLIAGIEWKF